MFRDQRAYSSYTGGGFPCAAICPYTDVLALVATDLSLVRTSSSPVSLAADHRCNVAAAASHRCLEIVIGLVMKHVDPKAERLRFHVVQALQLVNPAATPNDVATMFATGEVEWHQHDGRGTRTFSMHGWLGLFLLEPKLLWRYKLYCCLVDIRGYGVLGYGYAGLGLYVDMEVYGCCQAPLFPSPFPSPRPVSITHLVKSFRLSVG